MQNPLLLRSPLFSLLSVSDFTLRRHFHGTCRLFYVMVCVLYRVRAPSCLWLIFLDTNSYCFRTAKNARGTSLFDVVVHQVFRFFFFFLFCFPVWPSVGCRTATRQRQIWPRATRKYPRMNTTRSLRCTTATGAENVLISSRLDSTVRLNHPPHSLHSFRREGITKTRERERE
jgi:hypothetical protein